MAVIIQGKEFGLGICAELRVIYRPKARGERHEILIRNVLHVQLALFLLAHSSTTHRPLGKDQASCGRGRLDRRQ